MTSGISGILSIVILIADIWAIVNVFQSRASLGARVIWTILIIILPLVGLLVWLVAGPRRSGMR